MIYQIIIIGQTEVVENLLALLKKTSHTDQSNMVNSIGNGFSNTNIKNNEDIFTFVHVFSPTHDHTLKIDDKIIEQINHSACVIACGVFDAMLDQADKAFEHAHQILQCACTNNTPFIHYSYDNPASRHDIDFWGDIKAKVEQRPVDTTPFRAASVPNDFAYPPSIFTRMTRSLTRQLRQVTSQLSSSSEGFFSHKPKQLDQTPACALPEPDVNQSINRP